MFTTLIVQPIFNVLVLIYALLPGHNFGLSIILFTIVVRLAMWPLVKKQLHHTKALKALQPELKRIKQAAKGNRQQESMMQMELYKERGINPFAPLGVLIVQIPIFIALYSGINKILKDPHALVDFAYPFIQNFGWMKELAADITRLDSSLFGVVDLTRSALDKNGIYWPAMIIVAASAIMQYYQSKQLMPNDKEARSLKRILQDASSGKKADSSEVNAAVGRGTRYFLPALIFLFTVNIASALSLYFLVSGLVAFIQQSRVLGQDQTEMQVMANKSTTRTVVEGEVVEKKNRNKSSAKKKRRKR